MNNFNRQRELGDRLDVAIPTLITLNTLVMIYAAVITNNTGDRFWYVLVVIINMMYMLMVIVYLRNGR